jgi:uncharacterized membrane protein YjgN (DUF898 family)
VTARLGNVIYWAATGIAALWGLYTWFVATDIFFVQQTNHPLSEDATTVLLMALPAPIIWLVGRAARYVLAGR